MRKLGILAAVAIASTAFGVQPVVAQDLTLSILNSGKVSAAPVPVRVVEDGVERTVATSGAGGVAELDFADLDIPAGTSVAVHVLTCDGAKTVILVPPGETSRSCEEAERSSDCDCERVGVIPWGSSHATIDVGRGTVTSGAGAGIEAGVGYEWSPGLTIGAGVSYFSLTNLEDTGCFGTSNCEADDSGLGFGGYLEYEPFRAPFHVGVGFNYQSFGVEQDFGSLTNSVDVNALGYDVYAGWHMPVAPLSRLNLNLGFRYICNDGEIETSDILGTFRVYRSDGGIRMRLGAAFDYGFTEKFGARLGADYIVGDSDDADTQFAVTASLQYRLKGGY